MRRNMQKIALAALLLLALAGCGGKADSAAGTADNTATPTTAPADDGGGDDWEATAENPVTGQAVEGEVRDADFWDDADTVPAAEAPAGDGDFWDDAGAEELIELPGGGTAPAADFIFPDSGSAALDYAALDAAFGGLDSAARGRRSQLAINEIYARYGYRFHPEKSDTARQAYDYFNGLDWYTAISSGTAWSNTGEVPVNATEAANIELLVRWQKDHGLR